MKKLFLLLYLVSTWVAYSQEVKDIPLKGTILDANNQPIPMAYISIPKRRIGNVANLDGQFKLNINSSYLQDTLKVSAIGFKSKLIPINSLNDRLNIKVTLEEDVILLDDVSISASSKDIKPKRILRKAIERIPRNYPREPFSFSAFYRTAYAEDGEYVRYLETIAKIYDQGYSTDPNKLGNISIDFLGINQSEDHRKYRVDDEDGYLEVIFRSWDDIRSKSRAVSYEQNFCWEFKLDTILYQDQTQIFVVVGKQPNPPINSRNPAFVKLHVEDSTFAILEIESDYTPYVKDWENFAQPEDSFNIINTHYKSTYRYHEHEGKYYMHYNRYSQGYDLCPKNDDPCVNYTIDEETIIFQHDEEFVLPERIRDNLADYHYAYGYELYDLEVEKPSESVDVNSTKFETDLSKAIKEDFDARKGK